MFQVFAAPWKFWSHICGQIDTLTGNISTYSSECSEPFYGELKQTKAVLMDESLMKVIKIDENGWKCMKVDKHICSAKLISDAI